MREQDAYVAHALVELMTGNSIVRREGLVSSRHQTDQVSYGTIQLTNVSVDTELSRFVP